MHRTIVHINRFTAIQSIRNVRTQFERPRQGQAVSGVIKLEPENTTAQKRALRVAIIGPPNVGKSALTNELIRADVCAVSKRMDTTRSNTVTALTENDCQIVVVDSPGLIGMKHARDVIGASNDSTILADPEIAVQRADYLLIVHDATLPGKYINHRILHILHRHSHLPSSLVINKTDVIQRQSDLLHLAHILCDGQVGGQKIGTSNAKIGKFGTATSRDQSKPVEMKLHGKGDAEMPDEYAHIIQKPTYKCSWGETKRIFGRQTGWPNFEQLFFTSAMTGKGVDTLRSFLQEAASPIGTSEYTVSADQITTKKLRFVIAEHIRSEILNHMPGDIAYRLRVNVIEFGTEDDTVNVAADIDCEKSRWADLLEKVIPKIEHAVHRHVTNLIDGSANVRIRAKCRNSSSSAGKRG